MNLPAEGPPPSGPSGPPTGLPGEGAGNPWEQRDSLGFLEGLIEAIKLFVTSPTEAFARTRRTGDYVSPLIFAIIMGFIGVLVSQVWGLLIGLPFLGMVPDEVGSEFALFFAGSTIGLLVKIILSPIYVTVALFIWSGILHLCLMLIGGLDASESGFEGTFRVVSYSSVAQLAQVVPLLGGLVTLVWSIVLGVIGLTSLHRTTQGKALLAILLPMMLCCLCVVIAAIMAGGMAAFVASQS